MPDGAVRDYRTDIYARAIDQGYPSRRASLFDMSYAAPAEQAGTTPWTNDERFYNGARASSARITDMSKAVKMGISGDSVVQAPEASTGAMAVEDSNDDEG